MCTLTFFPTHNNGFILTSNRDESPRRETKPPDFYMEEGTRLLYPRDMQAGGTWIGVSAKQRVVCLLNGGFTAHEREAEYRMSRGIIVKDLLLAEDPLPTIDKYDFHGIEPFTVVVVDWNESLRIFELVWDGVDSHLSEKPLSPMIWSSSLLYTDWMKKKREQWFSEFLMEDPGPSERSLMNFHSKTGDAGSDYDLIMDRGFVKTKSITQIVYASELTMQYIDLQLNEVTTKTF